MKWNVAILRDFQVASSDGRHASTRSQNSKELLMLLALAGPAGVARRDLVAAFDSNESDPDSHFAVLLTRTRSRFKKFSELELIESVGDRICLAEQNVTVDCWLALEELKNACEAGTAERTQILQRCSARFGPSGLSGHRESAVTQGIRQRFCLDTLQLLSRMSLGALTNAQRSYVTDVLECIRPWLPSRTDVTEVLLSTFANLGLKDGVLSTYLDYESDLNEEFGERPAASMSSLVDDLLREMDSSRPAIWSEPRDPSHEFVGRKNEVNHLLAICSKPSSVFIHGPIGVGKSMLMARVYHHDAIAEHRRLWLDCDDLDESTILEALRTVNPEIVFVDQYSHANSTLVQKLVSLPGVSVVIGGHGRADLRTTYSLALRPFSVGTETQPGEAVQLLNEVLNRHGGLPHGRRDELIEMSRVCDGLPLALDLAARLASVIGLSSALRRIKRGASALSLSTQANRSNSLLAALCAGLDSLSSSALRVLAIVGADNMEYSTDTVLDFTRASIDVVVELADAGLVIVCPENETIAPSKVVRICSESVAVIGSSNEEYRSFVNQVENQILQGEFGAGPNVATGDVNLAASLIAKAFEANRYFEALKMLAHTRNTLQEAHHREIVFDWKRCVEILGNQLGLDHEHCLEAVGRNLFFRKQFSEIEQMFCDAEQAASFCPRPSASPVLLMQLGLALKVQGRSSEAEARLRQAVLQAEEQRSPGVVSKAYANLALLLDTVGRSREAVEYMDQAIDKLDSTVPRGIRVDYAHMRAMMRSKCESSDVSIVEELEFALGLSVALGQLEKTGHILQNIGLVHAKNDRPLESLACELTGTALLVGCDFSLETQRFCFSSFGTIGAMLLVMGERELANMCKLLIDRHSNVAAYEESAPYMQVLSDLTIDGSALLRTFGPSRNDVSTFVRHCIASLSSDAIFHAQLRRIEKITKRQMGDESAELQVGEDLGAGMLR